MFDKLKYLISLIFHRDLESQNLIDSTNNLENSKVLIVHGTHDFIVNPVDAKKIQEYYENFLADPNQVDT